MERTVPTIGEKKITPVRGHTRLHRAHLTGFGVKNEFLRTERLGLEIKTPAHQVIMDLVEADSDAITRKESYFRLSGRGIVQGLAVWRPSRECLESQSVRRHHTDLVAVNVIKNQI